MKSYIKKSHLHKPMKGQGSYDRAREEEHIDADLLAEYDLASYKLAHRTKTRKEEETNGEPDHG